MMLRSVFLALPALLLPVGAFAQSSGGEPVTQSMAAQQLAGAWDLKVDGATIFRFEIAEAADGEWAGRWLRPDAFNSDGNAFYNIRGGVKASPSMTGITFRDTVELAFDDPRPGAIPDIFRFRLTGEDAAEMIYVGTDLAPYALVRARAGDPMGSWDATRFYRRALSLPVTSEAVPDNPVPDIALPAITFDLADPTRANPQPVRRPVPAPLPVPAPQPEPLAPPETEAPEAVVPATEAEGSAAEDAEPAERPRLGYDFLEGL